MQAPHRTWHQFTSVTYWTCERFVIGVQRGGSTALRHYLSMHPHLTVSTPKEVHFYDRRRRNIPTRFLRQAVHRTRFPARPEGHLVDITPAYIFWPGALESIAATVRQPAGVATLRSPVARAVSQWRLEFSRGTETLDFPQAIRRPESEQDLRDHTYVRRGRYDHQIERTWQIFGDDRVELLRSEELLADPNKALAGVWTLFGVAATTLEPRVIHASPIEFEPSAADVQYLLEKFGPSIRRTETLTGWNLSAWLDPATAASL